MALLFVAMLYDIFERRIPNRLVVIGLCLGVLYQISVNGITGVCYGGVRLGLSVLVLFFFYQTSVLGAGDLKLISMMSLILNWEELGRWLLISGCFGVFVGVFYYFRRKVSFPFGVPLFAGMIGMLVME